MTDQHEFPDPTQIRHIIGASGSFSLNNVSGDIRIRGVDGDEVVVEARSERGRGDFLPLVVRRGESSLSIEIEQRGPLLFGLGWRNVPGIDFDISVPRGARVDVSSVSSDIEARGLIGDQEYKSVSGDIALDDEAGRVGLTTVSGDVRLTARDTVEPRVATTSGDVQIAARQIRALSARTVSGDLQLRGGFDPGANHGVETVSGDVDISAESGLTVEVRRGIDISGKGGRQQVVGDGAAHLRFRSLSGDLSLSGERARAGSFAAPPAPPVPPAPPAPPSAPASPAPPVSPAPDAARSGEANSLEILQALERGEIDIEEASRRLEGAGSHG